MKQQISPMISEFIFLEEDATKDEKSSYVNLKVEIREQIKDVFYRKTVTEVLLDLRKDVSGTAQKRLFELFKDLELHKVSYQKLKSWRWETISQGIRELTQMEVVDSYGFITKFINDKRATIRKQAEIAVVTLRHEGINYFLDTTKHRISEWQQLKLMEVIANKDDFLPPSFKVWLTSKNKYVVLFALRLIKHYDQNDANNSIIELVKHKNSRIKREAIDCIKTFHITSALETLKTVFWKCSADIKVIILDTIGELGSSEELDFLNLIENKETHFSVRSKALAAINTISPETILPTEGIVDTSNYRIPEDIKPTKKETMEEYNSLDENQEEIGDDGPHDRALNRESSSLESRSLPTEIEGGEETETAQMETSEIDATVENVSTMTPFLKEERSQASELDEEKELPSTNKTKSKNAVTPGNNTAKHDTKLEMEETNFMNGDENESKPSLEGGTPLFSIDFLPLVVDCNVQNSHGKAPQQPNLMNIEVFFEEIDNGGIPFQEKGKKISPYRFEIAEEDIHFIPLVVDTTEQQEDGTINQEEYLMAMNVVYEEIPAYVRAKEDEVNPLELIVYCEEIKSPQPKKGEINLLDLDVFYEEIKIPELLTPATAASMKEIDVTTLTVIYEEIKGVDLHLPSLFQSKESINIASLEVEFEEVTVAEAKSLDNMEVIFEPVLIEKEITEQELPNWLLEEIASPVTAIPKKEEIKMEGPEWDAKASKMMDDIEYYLKYIPEPKIYQSETAETMQMLDDIDFFGDEREIPLLRELMEIEEKEEARLRIKNIMSRFLGNNPDRLADTKEDLQVQGSNPYSIFEEFFRHCDTESKLILLDEIVAIGDEKEVYFLEQLLEDPEPDIRHKASQALAQLKERMSVPDKTVTRTETTRIQSTASTTVVEYEQLLDEMQIRPPKESDIFDIGFELSENLDDRPESLMDEGNEDQSDPDTESNTSAYKLFKKLTNRKRPRRDG
ncbi:hypothetical protein FK220_010900 [Flavobacteriaceae bacterium TP-CH-4]|uniref:HEAT repeat domain-containing protein n=1 Tax=Pelagihabitans pacificus TaxID=2696054 RepID=A0A967E6Q2_9FLAO|nr:hypothetical protein [Pelagihabitans pacificus]NHF59850.1 hypothetical protein [Pelagihabitans pacificus]